MALFSWKQADTGWRGTSTATTRTLSPLPNPLQMQHRARFSATPDCPYALLWVDDAAQPLPLFSFH